MRVEFGLNQDHLINLADKALYRAKENGRNQVNFSDQSVQTAIDDRIFDEDIIITS